MKSVFKRIIASAMKEKFNEEVFEQLYSEELGLQNYDLSMDNEQRIVTGSYYTPEKITSFHVEHILEDYQYHIDDLYLDPCVGSGNYIIALLKALKKDNIDVLDVINQQLWMVDVQVESMTAALLHILGQLVEWNLSLENLTFNVVIDNFLTSNGLDGKTFALIIANPPYIGEKGNTEVFSDIKNSTFGEKYYQGKMDCYGYFFYRGGELLADGGTLSYIIPNYFYTSDSARKLRAHMVEQFWIKHLIDFKELKVFPNAKGIHSGIVTMAKGQGKQTNLSWVEGKVKKKVYDQSTIEDLLKTYQVAANDVSINDNYVIAGSPKERALLNWVSSHANDSLDTYFDVYQGFVSGCDRLAKKDLIALGFEEEQSVFVVENHEQDNFKGESFVKPVIKNSQIPDVYLATWDVKYHCLYSTSATSSERLVEHLRPYKVVLDRRREVKTGVRKWHEMTWPREPYIFEDEKILVPQRAIKPYFCYHKGIAYGSADIYYIRLKEILGQSWSLKAFVAYLYTDIVSTWLTFVGKRKGEMFELYATPLKSIPVLPLAHEDIARLEALTNQYIDNEIRLEEFKGFANEVLIQAFPELGVLLEE